MDVYAKSFPNTQLWIDNVAGGSGTRKATSEYAAKLGVGLQNSALTTDLDSHSGYGDWTGQWDMVQTYSDTLSINTETRMGFGSDETHYWTYLAGLHYHPSVMTTHPDYLTQLDPTFLGWVNSHIGVTIADTPSVWTVLRDYEYPKQSWGEDGCSGKMGDWTFWMVRKDEPGALTVRTWDLPAHPLYDRQARRTDQVTGNDQIVFDVADEYIRDGYRLRVVYVDSGKDAFTVQYGKESIPVYKKDSGKWRDITISLPGYVPTDDIVIDCNSDGDETIHMIELLSDDGPLPTMTASATATIEPTPTATTEPTCTLTPTVGPTVTPACTPKPCWSYVDFSWSERRSIVDTALLGIGGVGEVDANTDQTYIIGVFNEQLGAPNTQIFQIDDITCRGFALGVVAMIEIGREDCKNYNVISWDYTQREVK